MKGVNNVTSKAGFADIHNSHEETDSSNTYSLDRARKKLICDKSRHTSHSVQQMNSVPSERSRKRKRIRRGPVKSSALTDDHVEQGNQQNHNLSNNVETCEAYVKATNSRDMSPTPSLTHCDQILCNKIDSIPLVNGAGDTDCCGTGETTRIVNTLSVSNGDIADGSASQVKDKPQTYSLRSVGDTGTDISAPTSVVVEQVLDRPV